MRKLLKALALIGVAAGVAVAVKNCLQNGETGGDQTVQITFDDGSTKTLSSDAIEGREFTDIARKLVEGGV